MPGPVTLFERIQILVYDRYAGRANCGAIGDGWPNPVVTKVLATVLVSSQHESPP